MKLLDLITDIMFPPICLFCGKPLKFGFRPLICDLCSHKESAFEGKCSRCGSEFENRGRLLWCNTCRSACHPFDGVVSAYFYSENVKTAIVQHKFNFNHNYDRILAYRISEIINELYPENKPDFLTFVPSSKMRLRERGYDSLKEIADYVSRYTGIELCDNCIVKHKHIPQQSRLSPMARMRNVRGCFKANKEFPAKGKSFILLDDVYTTGATTRECAKVLKRAGAKYVLIASVAISERFKK